MRRLVILVVLMAVVGRGCGKTNAGAAPQGVPAKSSISFNRAQVETLMSALAVVNHDPSLRWSYVPSNGDYEAHTSDDTCTFSLSNEQHDRSGEINDITMGCGPSSASAKSIRSEIAEEVLIAEPIIAQFAGSSALSWVNHEIKSTSGSEPVVAARTFGMVEVEVDIDHGTQREVIMSSS
jgi:hypothetical protein